MRVGLASFYWPPQGGGAERYVQRLAWALHERGCEVRVATASPLPGPEPGMPAIRLQRIGTIPPPARYTDFLRWQRRDFPRWRQRLLRWATQAGLSHLLLNHSIATSPGGVALTRELRRAGIRVGVIQHDLPAPVRRHIAALGREHGSHEAAQQAYAAEAERLGAALGPARHAARIASPLRVRPDFLITCSAWTRTCLGAPDTVPSIVLHPLLHRPRVARRRRSALPAVDLGFINPIPRKGALHMANIILFNRHGWSVRLLAGGWGDALASFLPLLEAWDGRPPARVDVCRHVHDIDDFFASCAIFVFPSRYEGYGLVAAEAMDNGVPVVATNFPAIRECVGKGAKLVPYRATSQAWIRAIRAVQKRRAEWAARARQRARQLRARERRELDALISFLSAVPGP